MDTYSVIPVNKGLSDEEKVPLSIADQEPSNYPAGTLRWESQQDYRDGSLDEAEYVQGSKPVSRLKWRPAVWLAALTCILVSIVWWQHHRGPHTSIASEFFPHDGFIELPVDDILGSRYDRIVAFGDSYTDIGRLPHPSFDYYNRFSNGPVAIEYIAGALRTSLEDWATGGAMIDSSRVSTYPFGDTRKQIDEYWNRIFPNKARQSERLLYWLWVGTNSVLNALLQFVADETYTKDLFLATLENDVQLLLSQIKSLRDLPMGRDADYVILGLPPLGFAPFVHGIIGDREDAGHLIREAPAAFTSRLFALIQESLPDEALQRTALIDIAPLWTNAISSPAQHGFVIGTEQCVREEQSEKKRCDAPEDYFWWDELHPTTKAHRMIGEFALSVMRGTFR